jgi:uncharacterized membrane protein YdbT with pleckstrin-like domain
MTETILWQGDAKSLVSAVTGGTLVTQKYRITDEYVFIDVGLLSNRAEQFPLWAIRDVDISSSMIQKARKLSNVRLRVEANDYTGAREVFLQNVETGRDIRDLINKHANAARLLRLQQTNTMHYSGVHPTMAQAPVSTAPPVESDPMKKLALIGELFKAGILTEEEFAVQKAKLIG